MVGFNERDPTGFFYVGCPFNSGRHPAFHPTGQLKLFKMAPAILWIFWVIDLMVNN
ncbi:MAG: hypothetical protein ACI965_001672 [Paraglaciecola sp.]|jgi:hypothetical protein